MSNKHTIVGLSLTDAEIEAACRRRDHLNRCEELTMKLVDAARDYRDILYWKYLGISTAPEQISATSEPPAHPE